ncbi:hypothetical protein HMN09_00165000 [Mycena chlorophos]|uniref:Uncharacterized protein n=1 Tax=Mycena chlorophos TaxID=658473 RepID=A0A8H6TQ63_MYCCL|nr:hypothetical protein HMN09_00165000 [Mycena chlorophos]
MLQLHEASTTVNTPSVELQTTGGVNQRVEQRVNQRDRRVAGPTVISFLAHLVFQLTRGRSTLYPSLASLSAGSARVPSISEEIALTGLRNNNVDAIARRETAPRPDSPHPFAARSNQSANRLAPTTQQPTNATFVKGGQASSLQSPNSNVESGRLPLQLVKDQKLTNEFQGVPLVPPASLASSATGHATPTPSSSASIATALVPATPSLLEDAFKTLPSPVSVLQLQPFVFLHPTFPPPREPFNAEAVAALRSYVPTSTAMDTMLWWAGEYRQRAARATEFEHYLAAVSGFMARFQPELEAARALVLQQYGPEAIHAWEFLFQALSWMQEELRRESGSCDDRVEVAIFGYEKSLEQVVHDIDAQLQHDIVNRASDEQLYAPPPSPEYSPIETDDPFDSSSNNSSGSSRQSAEAREAGAAAQSLAGLVGAMSNALDVEQERRRVEANGSMGVGAASSADWNQASRRDDSSSDGSLPSLISASPSPPSSLDVQPDHDTASSNTNGLNVRSGSPGTADVGAAQTFSYTTVSSDSFGSNDSLEYDEAYQRLAFGYYHEEPSAGPHPWTRQLAFGTRVPNGINRPFQPLYPAAIQAQWSWNDMYSSASSLSTRSGEREGAGANTTGSTLLGEAARGAGSANGKDAASSQSDVESLMEIEHLVLDDPLPSSSASHVSLAGGNTTTSAPEASQSNNATNAPESSIHSATFTPDATTTSRVFLWDRVEPEYTVNDPSHRAFRSRENEEPMLPDEIYERHGAFLVAPRNTGFASTASASTSSASNPPFDVFLADLAAYHHPNAPSHSLGPLIHHQINEWAARDVQRTGETHASLQTAFDSIYSTRRIVSLVDDEAMASPDGVARVYTYDHYYTPIRTDPATLHRSQHPVHFDGPHFDAFRRILKARIDTLEAYRLGMLFVLGRGVDLHNALYVWFRYHSWATRRRWFTLHPLLRPEERALVEILQAVLLDLGEYTMAGAWEDILNVRLVCEGQIEAWLLNGSLDLEFLEEYDGISTRYIQNLEFDDDTYTDDELDESLEYPDDLEYVDDAPVDNGYFARDQRGNYAPVIERAYNEDETDEEEFESSEPSPPRPTNTISNHVARPPLVHTHNAAQPSVETIQDQALASNLAAQSAFSNARADVPQVAESVRANDWLYTGTRSPLDADGMFGSFRSPVDTSVRANHARDSSDEFEFVVKNESLDGSWLVAERDCPQLKTPTEAPPNEPGGDAPDIGGTEPEFCNFFFTTASNSEPVVPEWTTFAMNNAQLQFVVENDADVLEEDDEYIIYPVALQDDGGKEFQAFTMYKRVDKKVRPVSTTFSPEYEVKRQIPEDPKLSMPRLSKNPPAFVPTERITAERLELLEMQQ